jgi:Lon protease-like protein
VSGKSPEPGLDLSEVALFPLPNVVLFPTAILPLHIFEERYKAMTADALSGSRLIAMALLRPGWQMNYYGRPAIEPVVCIGRIVSEERLPDGKYNFLLQGLQRARIVKEHRSDPYRTAHLEPLRETPVMEIDLVCQRQRLAEVFAGGLLSQTSVGRQFRDILSSPLTTPQIADLAAFNLLEDVTLKQSLLEDCDVPRRINRVIEALRNLRPLLEAAMKSKRDQSMN